MAEFRSELVWDRNGADFLNDEYSRRHWLRFDGGLEVAASALPHIVPAPKSDPAAVDPEEAFVASLSSCHMLWFLAIAARQRYVVDSYRDLAAGVMGRNAEGRMAMTVVTLRPQVLFSGENMPDIDAIAAMHRKAHEQCFVANSVKTDVRCEPVTG